MGFRLAIVVSSSLVPSTPKNDVPELALYSVSNFGVCLRSVVKVELYFVLLPLSYLIDVFVVRSWLVADNVLRGEIRELPNTTRI